MQEYGHNFFDKPQSGAEVPLPCPDWPYLPSSALWTPFRGHRPPLCAPRLAVAAPSHQLRLRYLVRFPDPHSLATNAFQCRPVDTFQGPQTSPAHTYNCCVRSIWRRTSPSVSRLPFPTLPHPVAHFQGPQTSPARTPIVDASDQSGAVYKAIFPINNRQTGVAPYYHTLGLL